MISKNTYCYIILLTSLFWGGAGSGAFAQSPNLVLNPSFENFTQCENGGYLSSEIPPWHSPSNSVIWYFNTCSQNSTSGAPQNGFGFQYPRTGNAYMGIYAYFNDTYFEQKRYIAGTFSRQLLADKIYCVSFYVALSNPPVTYASQMAITQLGAYISADSFYTTSGLTLPFIPQVESPPGVYLTDTVNWTEISGTFIAQGGEKYITLGNFRLPADTIRIQSAPADTFSRVAFYFIDDVSVTECGSVLPNQTACGSYTWYGQTYTSSGTYTQIVPNSFGGDSTLMLNLTILNNAGTSLTQTACNSFTYDGNTFSSSGTYVQHNQNSVGCDSTFTLYLTITNDVNAVINATACNSYTLNSITYNTTGTYTQHLTSYNGCDSVLALNLTINNDVSGVLSVSACNSYTLNAITYAIGGNYTQHLTSYTGCDSVLALNLTINNDVGSTLSVSACNSYTLNSSSYTASGTYVQNFAASNGCDSTITLYLSIDSSNAAVTITDPTLTAQSIGTYQWLNCSMDFAPILNATNQSYTATANGDYAVIITNGTCLDTSACYTIYTVGFNQIGSNAELIITPNPATNEIMLTTNQQIKNIDIYNVLGEEVLKLERIANSQNTIDISTWKAGVYFVEVETERGIVRRKFVKD